MAPVKIVWNRTALHELRSSPGAVAMANEILAAWASKANSMGKGAYGYESHQGRKAPQGRWRGTVFTQDWRAMRENARNNILVRVANG